MNKNKIIIFTGPSGVGKATVEEVLFKNKDLKLGFSVSMTTRKMRDGEKDGVQYYYVSKDKFLSLQEKEAFVETSNHFGNFYGTLKSEVDKILASGHNPFLEVEVNGFRQIIEKYSKEEYITIFLSPPSIKELKNRIISRSTETEHEIAERLHQAVGEMSSKHLFDHVVINDDPIRAAKEIEEIIKNEMSN